MRHICESDQTAGQYKKNKETVKYVGKRCVCIYMYTEIIQNVYLTYIVDILHVGPQTRFRRRKGEWRWIPTQFCYLCNVSWLTCLISPVLIGLIGLFLGFIEVLVLV